jgi:hypothetical protein
MSEVPGVSREDGLCGSASETLRLAFVRIAGVCAYTDPCVMGNNADKAFGAAQHMIFWDTIRLMCGVLGGGLLVLLVLLVLLLMLML